MLRPPRPRLKRLPINAVVPNAITVLALFAGLTGIRFGLLGQWEKAVIAIIVAGICDGLDGRLARLLKSTSRFGAELDSLSDFLSFGVAPALIVYQWTLHDAGGIGWAAVLVFATCSALRLARFNTALDNPVPPPLWQSHFFTGVPAPAGGALALTWLFVTLEIGDGFLRSPYLNALWLVAIGFLMISRLPTFSFKKVHLGREAVLPALIVVALVAAALVNFPWWSLTAISVIYLASIPIAYRSAQRMQRHEASEAAERPPEPATPEV